MKKFTLILLASLFGATILKADCNTEANSVSKKLTALKNEYGRILVLKDYITEKDLETFRSSAVNLMNDAMRAAWTCSLTPGNRVQMIEMIHAQGTAIDKLDSLGLTDQAQQLKDDLQKQRDWLSKADR